MGHLFICSFLSDQGTTYHDHFFLCNLESKTMHVILIPKLCLFLISNHCKFFSSCDKFIILFLTLNNKLSQNYWCMPSYYSIYVDTEKWYIGQSYDKYHVMHKLRHTNSPTYLDTRTLLFHFSCKRIWCKKDPL